MECDKKSEYVTIFRNISLASEIEIINIVKKVFILARAVVRDDTVLSWEIEWTREERRIEKARFQPFVKPAKRERSEVGGRAGDRAREIGQERKKERKKRDKPGAEKERRGCAREPKSPCLAKKRASEFSKSVRAFRVWLRWALAPTTPSREDAE